MQYDPDQLVDAFFDAIGRIIAELQGLQIK